MPSNTPNLALYKKNPATDGADTFNIDTMLNENWDKIDTAGGASNILAKVKTVDGAGSGLDADLFDGAESALFARLASPVLSGTPTAPTAAAGTNTTQIATTAFVESELSAMPTNAMSRQALINGNFDIWQRGTSFTTTNRYTADHWFYYSDGTTGTIEVSRQAFAPGQTEVPNNPKYFLRVNQTVAGSGQTTGSMSQKIEGGSTFAGQKVTVSFWAKSNVARNQTVNFARYYGSGGSPSPFELSASESMSIALATTWKKFALTFNLTSVAGKTFGTTDDGYLQLFCNLPLNAIFTFDIAQAQLSAGDVELPFQPRSFADELQLCKRYFEKSYTYETVAGVSTDVGRVITTHDSATIPASTAGNIFGNFGIRYAATKRVIPTVTIYATDLANTPGTIVDYTAGGRRSGAYVPNATENGFSQVGIDASSAVAITKGDLISFQWIADAEL